MQLTSRNQIRIGMVVGGSLFFFINYLNSLFILVKRLNQLPHSSLILDSWRFSDFRHYFGGAWLIWNSEAIYGRNLDFLEQFGFVSDLKINFVTNPPFLNLLLSPLGLMDPQTGWFFFQALSLLCAVGAVSMTCNSFLPDEGRMQRSFFLFGFVISGWLFNLILFSQIQAILFFLTVLIWRNLDRRIILTGVMAGLIVAIKFYLWPILTFLLVSRRLKELAIALFFLLVTFGITSSFSSFGLAEFNQYARPIIDKFGLSALGNLSFYGALGKSFWIWSMFFGLPVDPLAYAEVFHCLTLLASLTAQLIIISNGKKFKFQDDILFAAFLIISVLFSPVCWSHYLCFLIPGFCLVWKNQPSKRLIWTVLWLCQPWQFMFDFCNGNFFYLMMNILLPTAVMFYLLILVLRFRTPLSNEKSLTIPPAIFL